MAKERRTLPPPTPAPTRSTDPVAFALDTLGFQPWARQAEVLRAIGVERRVAVRSGHKVGKSRLAATAALWWWSAKPGARVVLTAPTGRQVRKVLWREILALHRGAQARLGGHLHETPDGGLVADDGRDIFGFAATEGESFSGVSGENVLYILDEASGIDEAIFEAMEGNRAGGASVLLLGNPTQTSGTFFRVFNEGRAGWSTHHISSIEAAEYQIAHGRVPGLATMEWVSEKRADGWEGTALWDVRVGGNFPSEGSDIVIGLRLVQAARDRWEEREDVDKLVDKLAVGVDVARYGDDESVVQLVRGPHAFEPIPWRNLDGPQLAEKVMQAIAGERKPHDKRPRVKVDVIGVGASCFDALRREKTIDAIAVNVGENATREPAPGETGFSRLRDQLWFGVRSWLLEGGELPDVPKLEADLVAPRYGFALDGRYKVESKDELKKRLGRSPDRGDALCLAVYEPPTTNLDRARAMASM